LIYVKAVDDTALEGDHVITLSHAVTGSSGSFAGISAPVSLNVDIEDNEKGGLVFSAAAAEVDEGGSLAMQVSLTAKPPGTSDVIISLNSSLPKGVVSFAPTLIKFEGADGGAWDVSQTVTMTVASDGGFAYGNRSVVITATASSTNSVYQKVTGTVPSITIRDVDTAGVTILPTSVQLTEAGGSSQFTVKLDSRPTSPVTITVAKDTPAAGLSESLSVTTATGKDLTVDASETGWGLYCSC
jgi:hypothetical protein